ncbi:thioredoxin family protein [Mesoflavibacter zeaxanthinifaciens]|uniref:thioredoxin family protein n=1 Tax=Mesoflavibacter zeaxanthinifaciens TaxID=393060 RepID=UPI003A9308B9
MALTPSNPFPLHTIAPEFSLEDSVTGKTFNLQQLKGKQATVIMFICNHCPFVIHVNSKLVELANQFKSQGVNFIAISSNNIENYPQDAPDKMKEVAAENRYPFPYLYDPTQDVAKAYDAACTPDFYVFDKDLKSTYHGRLDDSRPGNDKPLTGKDLIAAINSTLNNDIPLKNQLPSMGCNIKWK